MLVLVSGAGVLAMAGCFGGSKSTTVTESAPHHLAQDNRRPAGVPGEIRVAPPDTSGPCSEYPRLQGIRIERARGSKVEFSKSGAPLHLGDSIGICPGGFEDDLPIDVEIEMA